MSKDELHSIAVTSTPEMTNIPASWGGLIVWAAGKWGVGVIFLMMLVPVYADLKESNAQIAELSRANVQVLTALAQKIDDSNQRIARLDDALRRIEDTSAK
jgi:hypothetical protein